MTRVWPEESRASVAESNRRRSADPEFRARWVKKLSEAAKRRWERDNPIGDMTPEQKADYRALRRKGMGKDEARAAARAGRPTKMEPKT